MNYKYAKKRKQIVDESKGKIIDFNSPDFNQRLEKIIEKKIPAENRIPDPDKKRLSYDCIPKNNNYEINETIKTNKEHQLYTMSKYQSKNYENI